MNKVTLVEAVLDCKEETKNALQTVFDELNKGQQQKILKADAVKVLFDRYGVEY